jgi:alanyl-tRNA synthetase
MFLRRLLRRAAATASSFGFDRPFLLDFFGCYLHHGSPVCRAVDNGYDRTIIDVEESVSSTLQQGTELLERRSQRCTDGQKRNSRDVAFELYDTYGSRSN